MPVTVILADYDSCADILSDKVIEREVADDPQQARVITEAFEQIRNGLFNI